MPKFEQRAIRKLLRSLGGAAGEDEGLRASLLLEQFTDEQDQVREREHGVFSWIRLSVVLLLMVWLTWAFGFTGFLAGALLCTSWVLVANVCRAAYYFKLSSRNPSNPSYSSSLLFMLNAP